MSDPRVGARAAGALAGAGRIDPHAPEARLGELARARGALRRVLAGLAAELVAREASGGTGWVRLGYVRAEDYARERLGLSGRSLLDLARVGRALAGLPRLEAALVSGALPWSKVRLLARFVGPDDESAWIARARGASVRALEHRVRAVDRGALEAGAGECDEEGASTEPVETVQIRVGSALYFKWQRTREWAARVAGERVSPGTALEMVTAETLSALPRAASSFVGSDPAPAANVCATHAIGPEHEAGAVANVCAPHAAAAEHPLPAFLQPLLAGLEDADAFELDARLRRTVRLEQRLDAEIAPLLRQAGELAEAERQTCARPTSLLEGIRLRVTAPQVAARLFRAVLCSVRRAIEAQTGRLPHEAEAFEAMIDHALRSWGVDDPWLRGRARGGKPFAVFERDGWRCTIPGCTPQRNLHAHHIRFRARALPLGRSGGVTRKPLPWPGRGINSPGVDTHGRPRAAPRLALPTARGRAARAACAHGRRPSPGRAREPRLARRRARAHRPARVPRQPEVAVSRRPTAPTTCAPGSSPRACACTAARRRRPPSSWRFGSPAPGARARWLPSALARSGPRATGSRSAARESPSGT